VLASRRRSLRWLALAAAGPFGFSMIAALEDRLPVPSDRYQRFLRGLKPYSRVALEIVVLVAVWVVAYEFVVLKRLLTIQLESLTTGAAVSAILAQQNASGGMWAAGEGIEQLYLVPLLYLVWPIVFNLTSWLFLPRPSRDRRIAPQS
jgi:hypothetical protein